MIWKVSDSIPPHLIHTLSRVGHLRHEGTTHQHCRDLGIRHSQGITDSLWVDQETGFMKQVGKGQC